MEIERINEHTVKFYISYVDIEERGFDRDEIWYNREKSEELFWEMMDEVHQEEEFTVEGPLWIQIQALDKGLEVLVTRAQQAKEGHKFEIPVDDKFPVDEKIESLLDSQFNTKAFDESTFDKLDEEHFQFLIHFNDFEDVISLSHRTTLEHLVNSLHSYEGKYYLYIEFNEEFYSEEELENLLSIVLEYGNESSMTIHRLIEYGKEIMKENALEEISHYFPHK
ncbi:adaptor protein MecA [Bacillus sp. PS06]|uniref:adaptor protein MecA n=1 Tax=Bacillus sp. PS06 TaxID=2764176 RepID=UPI00177C6CCC|nr:adaptor protein MecA [Bacillus sp. PS06]MBD8067518.1 adaptor protein MecA [Bacillus sp. PS06]